MTLVEFESNFELLVAKWSKHYDTTFAKLLWAKIKDLPSGTFGKAVGDILGNHMLQKPLGVDQIHQITKGYAKQIVYRPYKTSFSEAPRNSPWPKFLEALMEMISAGKVQSELEYSLRFNRVSEEEAWNLYSLYVEKKFSDPYALKIISRKDPAAANKILETCGGL